MSIHRIYYIIIPIWFMVVSCTVFATQWSEVNTLETKLLELGYRELFQRLNDNNIDDIWNQSQATENLKKLVLNNSASNEARFLASEILFQKEDNYPSPEIVSVLAEVYAKALQMAQVGNPWGLPEFLDGLPAQHYVSLGEQAIPTLIPLLDDRREIVYEGSREATYGNSYRYRVKDFAAFYISQIRDIPYEVHTDPKMRDEEILKLKDSL